MKSDRILFDEAEKCEVNNCENLQWHHNEGCYKCAVSSDPHRECINQKRRLFQSAEMQR